MGHIKFNLNQSSEDFFGYEVSAFYSISHGIEGMFMKINMT